ncbi:hypothetical protein SNE40_002509 [Patella caerulea]|uniref:MADF domain-containing protein n=1 Tax=Patella caerulea TaxID=87958 RepID=A0AAN8K7W8_PATCE
MTTQNDTPIQIIPNKKSRVISDINTEEEESMVEWLKEHPLLYNKKLSSNKDKGKKDSLWSEQATLLGKDVSNIMVWYQSIRTRYGRLSKKKSGSGAGELTDRDNWILEKFDFLKGHIHEVRSRTAVSISDIYIYIYILHMHNIL